MIVLALPPRLSCRRRVSFESRYGMNVFLLLFCDWDCDCDWDWTRHDITLPKAVNDKLILVAYKNRYPVDPVLFCLYEPAKSTRLNLEPISFSVPSFFLYKDYTYIVNIECDRLDYVFINVYAVDLLWIPIFRYFNIYYYDVIASFLTSFMKRPCYGHYLSYNFVLLLLLLLVVGGVSKSRIY